MAALSCRVIIESMTNWNYSAESQQAGVDFFFSDGSDFLFSDGTDYLFKAGYLWDNFTKNVATFSSPTKNTPSWTNPTKN